MERPTTFADLMDLGWTQFYAQSKSVPTHRSEQRALLAIIPPATRLEDITSDLVADVAQQWLAEGASAKTVNRKLSMLSRLLRWAWRRGWIAQMPWIDRPKESRGRLRWVTDEELEQLLRILPVEIGDLVLFLANTGCRLSEALKMEWGQIDWEKQLVHLWETKSGYPRTVPLNEDALASLRNREDDRVDGGPFADLYQQRVQYFWSQARKQMGLEQDREFVLHALRHRVASRLVQRGVHLLVVKDLLGHRKIETTLRYAHLSPESLVDAVRLLN